MTRPALAFAPAYPATLYYDGSCALCAGEMRNLMLRNGAGRLRFVDCSPADFDAGPAPRAALMAAMHAQDAAGRIYTGIEAFRVAYGAVGLPLVSGVLGLPVVAQLTARAYPVLARNRHRLPRWLIAPLFEHASRRAAERAARRSAACAGGACELPPPGGR
jgi:predicted DCC family thiol-disulfide oxidoreductase YuxK